MKLEELGEQRVLELEPCIRAIRHDLGRYICFEQRFLEDPESVSELRRALRSDLLSTRRNGDEFESCQELWARLRPDALDGDPDVCVIDRAIEDIGKLNLSGTLEELRHGHALALEVRSASLRLYARHQTINPAEGALAEGWK